MKNLQVSKRRALIFALITVLIGTLGFLGRIPGMEVLGSFQNDFPMMSLLSAFSFVILGALLAFLSIRGAGEKTKNLGLILAGLTSISGVLSIFVDNLNIPITGANFILIGIALMLTYLNRDQEEHPAGDWAGRISSLVLALSSVYIFSYLFEAPFLVESETFAMGVTTALGFFFFSLGIISILWFDHFPGKLISGDNNQALLLRSFLPITALFILIGAVILKYVQVLELQSGNLLSFYFVGVIVIFATLFSHVSTETGRLIDETEDQRRKAENELINFESKFHIIFENSAIGIAFFDKEGHPYLNNPAMQKRLGYTEEELSKLVFADYTHPDDIEIDKELFFKLIKGKIKSYNVEKRYFTKNGNLMWGNLYVTLNRDSKGNLVSGIAMIEDITNRKSSEEKLKEYSDRLELMVEERTVELFLANEKLVRKERLAAIGEMAGGISHELRNPLSSIANAAYYLKMVQKDVDEDIIKYLDVISNQVEISNKIITSLNNFTRIQTVSQDKCKIPDLVKEVMGSVDYGPEIDFINNIPDDIPEIFVDRGQIRQVLINLVTNAIQAMPDGGRLEINASPEIEQVFVNVIDTGVGIKKENLKKLFEPLFSTKTEGIGLGLALSRKIIEANGGDIFVESEEGVGTNFKLALPRN